MTLTVDFAGTPLTGEEPLSVTFTLTYVVTSDADVAAPSSSGVKKRRPYRVRRADFSSDETYQLAIKAALADSTFAVRAITPDELPVVVARKAPRLPKTIPLDNSLSIEEVSPRERERLEREEQKLIIGFIEAIERDW
jgi:hypothetical protein